MQRPALLLVTICWFALVAGFVLRKRPPRAREVKRGRAWGSGLLLQGLSIVIVMATLRPPSAKALLPLDVFAVALAAASVWLMIAAERALGRQFAYQARLVEGHELITTGPYRYVRHPIYTAFFGLILATALAGSRWFAVPLFIPFYAAGTAIRIRSEENLLRAEFGESFESYARRTSAVLPGL